MYVIVQLREDVASELHNQLGNKNTVQQVNSEAQSLLNLATEIGVVLEPVHPNASDPLLTPFFMISVTHRELAERIILSLKQFTIVEAAYLKPDEQLP
jgi:hypothetical protein